MTNGGAFDIHIKGFVADYFCHANPLVILPVLVEDKRTGPSMKAVEFSRAPTAWLFAGLVSACLPSSENSANAEKSAPVVDSSLIIFEVAPDSVACVGVAPMRCLVVNGELFYDGIEGYNHREGIGRTLRIERTQICDPTVWNSCPQDIGIYRYRLVETIQ